MEKDDRSRKYQITINNPIDKGFNHEEIKSILNSMQFVYYCMCDEIGDNKTEHTHIYVCFKNAVYFSTIKKRFPPAHIEVARGSSSENRDYIRKEGKYELSDKKETNIISTFEEFGDMPLDTRNKNLKVSEEVINLILDNVSIANIIKQFPSYATKTNALEQARQIIISEEYQDKWRDLEVTYIYGKTATGKTSYVMNKYGYKNVCKITNYKNPFDNYKCQDVILFDEFRSSITISDMLQYLDGYPCSLPSRYSDKQACFTKVYIISNIPLDEQYKNIQNEQVSTWNAFVRRIHNIKRFEIKDDNRIIIDEFIDDYFMEENY